jgi:hypothetical protein
MMRGYFSAGAKRRCIFARIFHCAKRCFCACPKRGYFIAPRGDVFLHAQREDISLPQEEMVGACLSEDIK